MSSADNWSEVVSLFHAAVELTDSERSGFLDVACRGNAKLKARVLELIHADRLASSYLSGRTAIGPDIRLQTMPKNIGPYHIKRLIGTGGMGAVYLAERTHDFRRTVAIKVVKQWAPTARAVRRFRVEREILSCLEHPSIARLYDGGLDPDLGLYIVMEFVDGVPITDYCSHNSLALEQRLRLFRQVCGAVSFAHRNLVIHRDIKPNNILIGRDGVPKLLDFGIAKYVGPYAVDNTGTGRPMTPAYASPEQLLGRPVSTGTDVYSLGVVLYELLTGMRPYDTESTTVDAFAAVMADSIPPYPSEVAGLRKGAAIQPKHMRGDIDRLVLKALSRKLEHRYASVDALDSDIRLYLEGRPISARSLRIGYVARKYVERNRFALFGVAVAVLAIATVLTLWVQSFRHVQDQRTATRSLSSYLSQLFEIADPSLRADNSITGAELLDVGRQEAATHLIESKQQYSEFMALIGSLYHKIGDFESAVAAHADGLHYSPRNLPDTRLDNLLGLGRAHFELGNFDTADSILARTLVEQRRHKGWYHERTADVLFAQSEIALEVGDLDLVDSLVVLAMDVTSVVQPKNSKRLAKLVHTQGIVERKRGRYGSSVAQLMNALLQYDAASDADPLEVASALNSIGISYTEMGAFDLAGDSFRKALDIIQGRLGETHPRLGVVMINMANPIARIADEDSAAKLVEKAVGILEERRGAIHPDFAWGLHALGVRMARAGRTVRAESLYTAAIQIAEQSLPHTFKFLAGARHDMAILLRNHGNIDASHQYYRQAIEDYKHIGPIAEPNRSMALNGLGKVQRELGMTHEAVASFKECLAIRERILEPSHWRLGTAHSLLGETLAMTGSFEEAEMHLTTGVDILRKARGPDDEKTIEAVRRLDEFRNSNHPQNHKIAVAETGG